MGYTIYKESTAARVWYKFNPVLSGYCKMKNVGAGKDTCALEQDMG